MKEQGTMKKKKKIKVSEEMKNKVVDLYLNTDKTYNEISKEKRSIWHGVLSYGFKIKRK